MAEGSERKGFIQRLGPEAVVTALIAGVAVLAAYVSFQTHVQDFEIAAQKEMAEIKGRVAALEERERQDQTLLARVDARMTHVSEDMAALKKQMSIVLERLPKTQGFRQ